ACPATPSTANYNNANLPDPFTFADGTAVKTVADWTCRAAEIKQLIQADEIGTFPPAPSSVTATYSGGNLAITVTDGGKSISFTPTISLPSSGTAPYPAIIAYGGLSIPRPNGVAIITFNNDDIAAQVNTGSRGQGKFYNLYGSGHNAGAMTAWAWGVSRIIDALEKTPSANIKTTRIGVTGCSRNGKGALLAGALEPRVALTIPQESGSGGTDTWRISDYINSHGTSTQTASEIVGENCWFSSLFDTYAKSSVNKLPFDHHMLIGLIAPRAIFAIDQVGIDWLGPFSSYGSLMAARRIYQALNATTALGFSQSSSHTHCSFPSQQTNALNAYINKYLLDQNVTADVTETAGTYTGQWPGTWASWSTPVLTA
ncbi:Glucuronoyl esterase catalytic domain from Hypocrea Jecorina, partial [Flagelloscypha sp. PMI_526]